MKKYSIYFLASVIILLVSCQQEDDPTPTTQDPSVVVPSDSTDTNTELSEAEFNQQLAKRWDMGTPSPSGRRQSSVYLSIEFTLDGRYFVEKSDDDFMNGTYTISSDRRFIELSGFGTIDIVSIDEQSFVFTLTTIDQPTSKQEIASVASDPMVLADSDQYLLGAWNMESFYYIIDGDTIRSDDPVYKMYTGLDTINVYFTQYGTYFIEYHTTDGNVRKEKNYWQWSGNSTTDICYADWRVALEDRNSVCNNSNKVSIVKVDEDHFELTQDQSMTIDNYSFQFKIKYSMARVE